MLRGGCYCRAIRYDVYVRSRLSWVKQDDGLPSVVGSRWDED